MAKTTNGSSRGKKSYGGGLKKTIACATTVAALASSANARRDVDGAAFLETFDDGLKGWVKSEVEQYTGALLFSFALFSFFFSLSLSLSLSLCVCFASVELAFFSSSVSADDDAF